MEEKQQENINIQIEEEEKVNSLSGRNVTSLTPKSINQANFTPISKRNTLIPTNSINKSQTTSKKGLVVEREKKHASYFDKSNTNLDLPGCKMKDQKDWIDDVKCSLCLQVYNKMKLLSEHHCRYCGKSVCHECSKRTINELRVCDFCFLKKHLRNSEKRRKEFLKSKDHGILQMKESILALEEQTKIVEQQISEAEAAFKIEHQKMQQKIWALQEEVRVSEDTLKKRNDNNSRLKRAVETDTSILKEKEQENNQIKDKIQALKIEITYKENKIKMKKGEFQRLQQQNRQLIDTESFMELEKNQQESLEYERQQYQHDKVNKSNTTSSLFKKKQQNTDPNLGSIREEPLDEDFANTLKIKKSKEDEESEEDEEDQKKEENKNKGKCQKEQDEEFEEYNTNDYNEEQKHDQKDKQKEEKKKKKAKDGKKQGCQIF